MNSKPRILVTGASGQVGSELRDLAASHPSFDFVFLTRNELPLTDNAAIERTVREHHPAIVINCAAYTAVDKAESEREEAFQTNAIAVGVMAKACAEVNARFLHISTDYVFDGSQQGLRKEDDPVAPINMYGESKLAGERLALQHNPESVIIRTSWVYSTHGKNFVKTMLRLMSEKESISVVNDQSGSPTYAADLAEDILTIVVHSAWHPGIYHFSNEGVVTWFDFATEIAALSASNCRVLPTNSASFPTPARRPAHSAMDKGKMVATFGIEPKPWRESLARCVAKLVGSPS